MKKRILLISTAVIAITLTTGSIVAFSGNKFSGMTKQQKIEKRDLASKKIEQLKEEAKQLNDAYFKTDDAKNGITDERMKPETKKLLDQIKAKNQEIDKYQMEYYEVSQEEDLKDYKTQLERGLETISTIAEDEKPLLQNASSAQKPIYIELNNKRKALYDKYSAKLSEKNVNYKELYNAYTKEVDALMKDFRTKIDQTK